jgi:hypothetical protein
MNQQSLFETSPAEPTTEQSQREERQLEERRRAWEGERRADAGIKRAVRSHSEQVGTAREMAFDIARGVLPHADGEKRRDWLCNADDVAAAIKAAGMPALGNEAGGVFRDGNWEVVAITKAKREASNANLIRQWRRKDEARTEG